MKLFQALKQDHLSFEDFREVSALQEALVTFKGQAYPKFGNIVVLAGGAGSGKGFVLQKLLGIEGKVFDVDEVKRLSLESSLIMGAFEMKTGIGKHQVNFKNPHHVSTMHEFMEQQGIVDKQRANFFKHLASSAAADRLPNLIFDMTLKDFGKLLEVHNIAQLFGYDLKNVHIVWILTDFNIAAQQNAERSRTVPAEVFMDTHVGASLTMRRIVDLGPKLRKYMDGDIWIVMNTRGVDSKIVKSVFGGSYIQDAVTILVKKAGAAPTQSSQLDKDIRDKINKYTPDVNTRW